MSAAVTDALELAGKNPGEPGQTSRAAGRPRSGSTGRNPGETAGSTAASPAGGNVTQKSGLNQGGQEGPITGLIELARKLGATLTMRHLQAAAASAGDRDYEQGVVHLSRAHETARQDGNVQLMNGIQRAANSLRQVTP